MSTSELLFRHQKPGVIPWTLLGFIFLSAVLHALGFYIFQTVYPPVAHIGPPPVQVGLLVPGTPEADAILRWIDSEDPSLAAEPAKAPIPGLMALPYIPSYSSVHARPVMAAAPESPLPYPAGASGLEVIRMAGAGPSATPPPPPPAGTTLTFTPPLREAQIPPFESLRESELGELQTARFLLGVSGEGKVQYIFIQKSSGDKGLDEQASRLLESTLFTTSSNFLTWGYAVFHWGASVFAHPGASPEQPEASP